MDDPAHVELHTCCCTGLLIRGCPNRPSGRAIAAGS